MIQVNGIVTDCLPVTDRGLLYGDGVWETLAVRDGQPQLLDWHLQRLAQGLAALAIQPPDMAVFQHEILAACAGWNRAVLKLIVTRGTGARGYDPRSARASTRIVQLVPRQSCPAEYATDGIRVTLCETRLAQQPRLAGFKHLNRLEQVLARGEFGSEYQEGLVMDYAGHIVEGTLSNLFVIDQGGTVSTPDLSQCGIAGVMRRFVMQVLADSGVQCHIRHLDLQDMAAARAAFMTNSLIGVWPVSQFLVTRYAITPLIRTLQLAVDNLT